jgi:hypothetical protein
MGAAVAGIVHERWTVDRALASMAGARGRALDEIARYF